MNYNCNHPSICGGAPLVRLSTAFLRVKACWGPWFQTHTVFEESQTFPRFWTICNNRLPWTTNTLSYVELHFNGTSFFLNPWIPISFFNPNSFSQVWSEPLDVEYASEHLHAISIASCLRTHYISFEIRYVFGDAGRVFSKRIPQASIQWLSGRPCKHSPQSGGSQITIQTQPHIVSIIPLYTFEPCTLMPSWFYRFRSRLFPATVPQRMDVSLNTTSRKSKCRVQCRFRLCKGNGQDTLAPVGCHTQLRDSGIAIPHLSIARI